MKFTSKISPRKLLVAVFILAFVLRFYKLGQIPAGFFFDEVTLGVNSYYLSSSLHDEYGNFLPDFIRIGNYQNNDFRHGLVFYVAALFIKLFGFNEFSVRSASAAFGVLMIPAVFLLVDLLFKNKKLALVSSLLVAISPWQINLSRNGMEVIPSLFLLTLSDLLFLRAILKGGRTNFVLAYISMVATWFSYVGVIPISLIHFGLITLFALVKEQGNAFKKAAVITFICFIIFPSAFYWLFARDKVSGRFGAVSAFSENGTQLVLNEQIREDGMGDKISIILTRIFHNKVNNFSTGILNNYLEYFSPGFLLGQNILPLRYRIPNFGLIFYIDLPFIFLGAFQILKKPNWQGLFIILVFISGPVAASLTVEDVPDIQRAVFMNPALQIITAIGVLELLKLKINKLAKYLLIFSTLIFYLYFFTFSAHQFLVHQLSHRNWYRNSQWKEAVFQIDKLESNYSQIVSTKGGTEPYYYLFFYSQKFRQSINKEEYLKNRNFKGSWNLGKFSFVHQDCVIPSLEEVKLNTLYITGQICDIPYWARVVGKASTSDGATFLTFVDVPQTTSQLRELILKEQSTKQMGNNK